MIFLHFFTFYNYLIFSAHFVSRPADLKAALQSSKYLCFFTLC